MATKEQEEWLRSLGQTIIERIVGDDLVTYLPSGPAFVWGVNADLQIGKVASRAILELSEKEKTKGS